MRRSLRHSDVSVLTIIQIAVFDLIFCSSITRALTNDLSGAVSRDIERNVIIIENAGFGFWWFYFNHILTFRLSLGISITTCWV